MGVDRLSAALARPEGYPGHPQVVEVRETHISYVFLAGDRAYKLKKPLVLPFLDYGTPARRLELCREEMRLNRRLAHDIYLGVLGVVTTDAESFRFVDADDPEAEDYVVEMRRYDEHNTLASKLARGDVQPTDIDAIGARLALFHDRVERVAPGRAPALILERRFEQNAHELLGDVEQQSTVARILALERFAHAFVGRSGRLLEHRARDGFVREGHGDVRAEHVLLEGDVQIVDCVEFDRSLRELDVADDLAFLVLDLAAHGGGEFTGQLLGAYRDAGGDPGDDALISFYAAYRALVRSKVALIRALQHNREAAKRKADEREAGELLALAELFAWKARQPLVIAVCGVPASGKSYLASALADAADLPHLSSDMIRKELFGIAPSEHAPLDAYSDESNARTHHELGRVARREVAASGGAIVDATFRHLADRETFAGAFGRTAQITFVQCLAPRAVLEQRAIARDSQPGEPSDADVATVRHESTVWDPLDEIDAHRHLALRTDRAIGAIVADVVAMLDLRLTP